AFVLSANVTAASASSAGVSTSASASSTSGSLAATTTSAVGLSLGTFSSSVGGSTKGTTEAVLVSVEGNTYMSVPILGFGSEQEEEGDGGDRRMPWLSARYPVGDASPLAKFLIGLDEALRDYRGALEDDSREQGGAPSDPWTEDLFRLRLPVQPPA